MALIGPLGRTTQMHEQLRIQAFFRAKSAKKHPYVVVCTRVLLVCYRTVYVTRMLPACYSYVTRMLLVCYPYVLVCCSYKYSYVTRMYLYVTRMYSCGVLVMIISLDEKSNILRCC